MKVSRDDAVAICVGVGFKGAKRWDKERIEKKMTEFATDEAYAETGVEEDNVTDEEERDRLNELLGEMREAAEEVEVVEAKDDEEEEEAEEEAEESDEEEEEAEESEEEEEVEEEAAEEDEDEEEQEELTLLDLGRAADDGDKAAAKEVSKRAKACGLDPDDYKSWTSCAKAIEGEPPKKGKKAKKEKKEKKPRGPSAFGTALEMMCANPDMPYADLKKAMMEKGLFKSAAVSTAYSSVKKVVKLLRANKKMK